MKEKSRERGILRNIDGILAVNKPKGPTSSEVTELVKRWGRFRKVGHTGTLDPSATGLLCLAINRACRIAGFLLEGDKRYSGTLTLGAATDTMDGDGRVLYRREWKGIEEKDIYRAFGRFSGRIVQKVPPFSAKKVRGVPLYRYTRRGQEVDGGEKEVEIREFHVESIQLPDVHFSLHCSKGTYVRALCHDVGETLGCGAYLSSLERTRSGAMGIERALTLEEIKGRIEDSTLADVLVSPMEALADLPRIDIPRDVFLKILWGGGLLPGDLEISRYDAFKEGDAVRIVHEGILVAVAKAGTGSGGSGVHRGRRLLDSMRMLVDLKDLKKLDNSREES